MASNTFSIPVPPTIPGSIKLDSSFSRVLKVNTLISGDIQLVDGSLTGLDQPTSAQEASNKEYSDQSMDIWGKSLTSSDPNNVWQDTADDTVNLNYSGQQIIGKFLQRNPNGGDRTDTFPTAAQLVAAFGPSVKVGSVIESIIQNMSTNVGTDAFSLTINLVNNGITVPGSPAVSLTPVINPLSLMVFRLIFTNITSGSEAVSVQYFKTTNLNLSNYFYREAGGMSFRNVLKMSNVYSTSMQLLDVSGTATTYTASTITNSIINRTTTIGVSDTLPTAANIRAALGFTTAAEMTDTFSFNLYVRNIGTGALTLLTNTGLTLESNSTFTIPADKAATLLFVGTAFTDAFTVYTIRIADY